MNVQFEVERSQVGGTKSIAYGCDSPEDLAMAVIGDIDLDVMVTISGVTAPLTFWRDPEHWSEDWQRKLALDDMDDAPYAVAALIANASTD